MTVPPLSAKAVSVVPIKMASASPMRMRLKFPVSGVTLMDTHHTMC